MMHDSIRTLRGPGRRAAAAILLAVAAMAFAGCAAVTSSGFQNQPPPQAPSGTVSLCNQTESGCDAQGTYTLASARDIAVTVNWSHVPEGTHTQTLELLDPKGGLFEVRSQAFAVEAADSSASTSVLIPVSGTFITERAIAGQWAVRVSLDGQSQQTKSFTLLP